MWEVSCVEDLQGDTGHVALVALGPIWDVCTSCARGGTHVRAKGKAEIEEQQLAAELRVGPGRAGVIDECEWPTDRLATAGQFLPNLWRPGQEPLPRCATYRRV